MAKVEGLSPQQQQQNLMMANMQARQAVLQNAFPVVTQVDSQTFDPASRNQYDISGTNVGIVTGFTLQVKARIKNNHATESVTLTDLNVANLLQRVEYYDPNNQRHIATDGWHIALVNTVKGQKPFGGVGVTDTPIKYGDNYKIIDAAETIAAGASADVIFYYWIPLAYSDIDLTGAVFANVAQSKQRLHVEFATNSTAFAAADGDKFKAIYAGGGSSACVIEQMSYACYQHYFDQLPSMNGAYIVPQLDLSTLYLLENSVVSGMTPNTDFQIQYGNLYRYLSTVVAFDNGGVFNAGSDINHLGLQTANYAFYRKSDPETWNLVTRKLLNTDLPKGIYLSESRAKPIYTLATGNQTFILNAKTVAQNARAYFATESFVTATTLVNVGTVATT